MSQFLSQYLPVAAAAAWAEYERAAEEYRQSLWRPSGRDSEAGRGGPGAEKAAVALVRGIAYGPNQPALELGDFMADHARQALCARAERIAESAQES